jgi:hypothetical protein
MITRSKADLLTANAQGRARGASLHHRRSHSGSVENAVRHAQAWASGREDSWDGFTQPQAGLLSTLSYAGGHRCSAQTPYLYAPDPEPGGSGMLSVKPSPLPFPTSVTYLQAQVQATLGIMGSYYEHCMPLPHRFSTSGTCSHQRASQQTHSHLHRGHAQALGRCWPLFLLCCSRWPTRSAGGSWSPGVWR